MKLANQLLGLSRRAVELSPVRAGTDSGGAYVTICPRVAVIADRAVGERVGHATTRGLVAGRRVAFVLERRTIDGRTGAASRRADVGLGTAHSIVAGRTVVQRDGFTIAGAIVPGEGTDCIDPTDEPKCNNGLADSYSVAAMYSNNGLYLAAAYENLASTERDDAGGDPWGTFGGFSPALSPISGDSHSDSIHEWDEPLKKWRIGIGYTINAFTLGAVYENQDSSGLDSERHDRTNYEADIWQISGAYDFGNNRVKVAYGENKANLIQTDCDTCDKFHGAKSKHFAIGLDHKLSKRTTAYLVYAQADIDDIFEEDSTDSGDDRLYQGGEESGFSIGLIHNF